jgi:amidase
MTVDSHLADLGVAEIVRRTTEGGSTSVEVLEACLSRIAERDPALNAFSVVLAEQARAEAAELDRRRGAGDTLGPLHGVPVAVKEELDVAGCVTTFGGRANSTPVRQDGEVVRRLREAGAVIIGKTRMPEFGAWPFTESVDGGITRNPWNPERSPGGSSGGTAVAVAAGMVPVGIGGDGGGSIRIPAASCGLFGLKPQRGRVSSSPMDHLWWALGTAGPLSRSVLDSAIVYDAIRGPVEGDLFVAGRSGSFTDAAQAEPGRLRIGWSTKSPTPGVRAAAEHVEAVRETARLLEGLGHDVSQVDPRFPDPTVAFVPQYLSGIRAESQEVEHYDRLELRTRQLYRLGSWAVGPVVARALEAGRRAAVKANRVFDDVDVLLMPTTPGRPPRTGVLDGAGAVRALAKSVPAIAYTAIWNVTGNPAASVPAGVAEDGLPLACQLVGRPGAETVLLSVSAQLEAARPWAMPDLQVHR